MTKRVRVGNSLKTAGANVHSFNNRELCVQKHQAGHKYLWTDTCRVCTDVYVSYTDLYTTEHNRWDKGIDSGYQLENGLKVRHEQTDERKEKETR